MNEDKKPQDPESSLEAQPEEVQTTVNPTGGENGAGDPAADAPKADTSPDFSEEEEAVAKSGGIKRALKRFNLYLLLFLLLVVIAAVITYITIQKSQEKPVQPDIASQNLSKDQLKQIANSNATVGDSGQTLTIQGNTIINGDSLLRKDLSVAGNFKLGGDITASNITASGNINLGATQVKSLQIAEGTTINGDLTLQKGLNVAGATSLNGPVTVKSLTVTNLTVSGDGGLTVPNHIKFPGATPSRTSIGHTALGGGGTARVTGSDTAGTFNINTGNNPAPGCFITIKFHEAFSSTPHVVVTPINDGAGSVEYYVKRNTTSMSLCTDNAAPAHKNFAFDYFITD